MPRRKRVPLLVLVGVLARSGSAFAELPEGVRIAAFNVEFGSRATPEEVAAALDPFDWETRQQIDYASRMLAW